MLVVFHDFLRRKSSEGNQNYSFQRS